MSVPLDRLYNFLSDISNHDIVIYRFFPHGSKKSTDLHVLTRTAPVSQVCDPHMLCHDQEPLDINNPIFNTKVPRFLHNIMACNLSFWSRCMVLHSELNSDHVRQISKIAEPVYWWSHALIAQDWFRYAQHDPGLESKQITHTFLIYNRAWCGTREYRLYVADQLVKTNLANHCLTSFNAIDGGHYRDHKFVNIDFTPTHDLEQFFKVNQHCSSASADYNTKDYQSTLIEVVLETLFDDNRWHLTEKTLRPIACGQPFMLLSTPGALKYLRRYGFETFDPVIDESYDNILNPTDRVQAVIQQMQRVLSHDKPTWLAKELQARSRHNKQRFFSKEFFDQVVGEYQHNLEQALQQVMRDPFTKYASSWLKHSQWKAPYTRSDAREIWLRYHRLPKNR